MTQVSRNAFRWLENLILLVEHDRVFHSAVMTFQHWGQCWDQWGCNSSIVGSWQFRGISKIEDYWTRAPMGNRGGFGWSPSITKGWCPNPFKILSNCAKIDFPSARLHGNFFLLCIIRIFSCHEQDLEGMTGNEWQQE